MFVGARHCVWRFTWGQAPCSVLSIVPGTGECVDQEGVGASFWFFYVLRGEVLWWSGGWIDYNRSRIHHKCWRIHYKTAKFIINTRKFIINSTKFIIGA